VAYEEDSLETAGVKDQCLERTDSVGFSDLPDSTDGNSDETAGLKRHISADAVTEDGKCSKTIKVTLAEEQESHFSSDIAFPVCISKQLKALGIRDIVPSHVQLLQSSVVEQFMSLHSQGFEICDGQTNIFVGIVFERCPVTENRYPTRRELMIVARNENCTNFDEFSAKALACVPDVVMNRLRIVHHSEADFESVVCSEGFVFQSHQCEPRIVVGLDFQPDLTDLKAYEPCSSKDTKILDDTSRFNPLGYIGLFTPQDNTKKWSSSYSYFVLDLDKLTKEMCAVSELRLLWSQDHRIFSSNPDTNPNLFTITKEKGDDQRRTETQNKTLSIEKVAFVDLKQNFHSDSKDVLENKPSIDTSASEMLDKMHDVLHRANPLSLYPIKHRHDVTFWEKRNDDFDEQLFFDSIRNIADDNVKSATLVNEFDHGEYGHSRCYRLIYQSCDKALSYLMSHDLQNTIRLTVEAEQCVTLR
jgi:hypothetical protein